MGTWPKKHERPGHYEKPERRHLEAYLDFLFVCGQRDFSIVGRGAGSEAGKRVTVASKENPRRIRREHVKGLRERQRSILETTK